MRFRTKQPAFWEGVLSEVEVYQLGRYNSERMHGIVHTEVWVEKMAELQRRFDSARMKSQP